MDQNAVLWARLIAWAVAIILFIIGGYSDTNTSEWWGWGFSLLTAGFLLKALPAGMMGGMRRTDR